jgi:hypothetical protein
LKELEPVEIKRGNVHNLRVSWDYEDDKNDRDQRFVVLLFTPNLKLPEEREHIALSKDEARRPADWLNEFLKLNP